LLPSRKRPQISDVNFVAMDVVKYPRRMTMPTTSLGASLVMEYLCLKARQRGARATNAE
jgi:hypothetical protein